MVDELSELHEHEGVAAVQVRDVGVHHDRDEAGRGEGLPAHGPEARSRNGCGKNEKRFFRQGVILNGFFSFGRRVQRNFGLH